MIMNLIEEIVKKYKTDGIRGVLYGAILRIYLICLIFINRIRGFDGKDLDVVQSKIQKAIKKRPEIYNLDEADAKALADNWNGVINKPQDLRFIEHAIPVVLTAGERFVPYMAVTLQSLLNNSNSERKYHFIILNEDFSDKTKELLTQQVSHFSHCAIDFVNIVHAFNGIPIAAPGAYYSIGTYSRFFIPYWFDKYEKVIFLDSDIMAKADIAELYDIDISDSFLGAAVDQIVEEQLNLKSYGFFLNSSPVFMLLNNWSHYFNAGILIFDTKKFKTKISQQDIFYFTIYYSNRYNNIMNDQDILNLLMKDDYYVLPPEWNYMWSVLTKNERYQSSKPNTKIVHFTSILKPWINDPLIEKNSDVLEYRKLASSIPLFKLNTATNSENSD